MTIGRLALHNVKSGMKNYLSLILSLAFTVLIFLNFQMIVFSDVMKALGAHNKSYIDIIVETVSVVLGCFMFFFISYAMNVFLTRRKKEIGIYAFLGLTNQRIGKLYMLEMSVVGVVTLLAGIGSGLLFMQLFQMLLLKMSDITVSIGFSFAWQPILITAGVFLLMYAFFLWKGYRNLVKSSILSQISASRRNEYVKWPLGALIIKTALGIGILSAGYYLAVKEGGAEVMQNVLMAVALVIAGVYLLFGGFVPLLFQSLAKNKHFLYRKERNLWMNQIIFRMKKNYRTYAMVCILMICSVTALAASFAMKMRYENIVRFRNTYSFQLLSGRADLLETGRELIGQDNDVTAAAQIPVLIIPLSEAEAETRQQSAAISYSALKTLAGETGLAFDIPELAGDELAEISHLYLLSLLTERDGITVTLHGKKYRQVMETSVPYLGYLQESMRFFCVSDAEYERLRADGTEQYVCNYKIADIGHYKASMDELDAFVEKERAAGNRIARVAVDPKSSDIEWIKILYSLCVFMFMVFVLAGGSILFMKLSNDAFEEKERYAVLKKLGCSGQKLCRSAAKELLVTYAAPFFIMLASAYFSVHAMEKMMFTDLTDVLLASAGIIFVFLSLCYGISVSVYVNNAGIRDKKE